MGIKNQLSSSIGVPGSGGSNKNIKSNANSGKKALNKLPTKSKTASSAKQSSPYRGASKGNKNDKDKLEQQSAAGAVEQPQQEQPNYLAEATEAGIKQQAQQQSDKTKFSDEANGKKQQGKSTGAEVGELEEPNYKPDDGDISEDPFAKWERETAEKNQHYQNFKEAEADVERLRQEGQNRSQIWEDGIYVGEDKVVADEYAKRIAEAQARAQEELAASGGERRFEDQTALQKAGEVAKGVDTGAGNQFASAISGVGAALAGRDTIIDDLLTAGRAAINRDDGVSAGQALRSLDDIVNARIEEDFTRGVENIRDRGAGIFNKVFGTNIDTQNDWASQKHQEKAQQLNDERSRFHKALGDVNNPFANFNDLRKAVAKEQAEQKQARYANAPAAGLIDKYGTMAGASLPTMAIATGMALAGHPEASAVLLQEGSTASLAYAAALNSSSGLTQLSTIMTHSLGELASNPTFWMAYGTEMGNAYNEAIDEGADQTTASLYAAAYGGISALVELGGGGAVDDVALGGLEKTAPGLIQALKMGDKVGAAKIFAGNILSEIAEEEIQGGMERGMKSMYTDVPIYSDGKRTVTSDGKVVETPEGQANPNAIINPGAMAETAVDTAITTALLGGGQQLVARGANALGNSLQARADAQNAASTETSASPVIQAIQDRGGQVTTEELQQIRNNPELQAEFEDTFGVKLQDNGTDVQYQSNAAELNAQAQDTVRNIIENPAGENGELSNNQIRQIVNDPQLRQAFKDVTGFDAPERADSDSRTQIRRAIDAYETNQETAELEAPEETAEQDQKAKDKAERNKRMFDRERSLIEDTYSPEDLERSKRLYNENKDVIENLKEGDTLHSKNGAETAVVVFANEEGLGIRILDEDGNEIAYDRIPRGYIPNGSPFIAYNLEPDVPASATSKFNIDNTANANYNNVNNTTGEVIPNGTGREGSAGANQEGVSGISRVGEEEAQSRGEYQESSGNAGFVPLSDDAKTTIGERGISVVDISPTTDYAAFSAALDDARAADPAHGWAVTPKTVEDLNQPGNKVFLSADGSTGFVITPDGDIEAVFKNQDTGTPRSTLTTLTLAIANGGKKLDCFGPDLANIYAQFGFIPVARVKFDPEIARESNGWDESKGEQDIIFLMHNGDSADRVANKYGRYAGYTDADLESLPMMDYMEAMEARDAALATIENIRNRGSISPREASRLARDPITRAAFAGAYDIDLNDLGDKAAADKIIKAVNDRSSRGRAVSQWEKDHAKVPAAKPGFEIAEEGPNQGERTQAKLDKAREDVVSILMGDTVSKKDVDRIVANDIMWEAFQEAIDKDLSNIGRTAQNVREQIAEAQGRIAEREAASKAKAEAKERAKAERAAAREKLAQQEQQKTEAPAEAAQPAEAPSTAKRTIRSMMDNAAKNDEAGAVSQADAMKILDSKELFQAYQDATGQTADEARQDLNETAGIHTGASTDQKVPPRVEQKWKKAAETDAESLIDLVESDENDSDWFKRMYQDATGQELSDDPAIRIVQLTDFAENTKNATGKKKGNGKAKTPRNKTNATEGGLNRTETSKTGNADKGKTESPKTKTAKEPDVVDALLGKDTSDVKIPKAKEPSKRRKQKISQYFLNTMTKNGEAEGVDPITYNPESEAESLANAVMRLSEDYQGMIDLLIDQQAWTNEMVDAAYIIGRQLKRQARRAETPEQRAAAEKAVLNWKKIRTDHISKTGGGLQAVAKQSRATAEAVFDAAMELFDKYSDKKVAKRLGISEEKVNKTRENVTQAVNELEELENRLDDYEEAKKEGKADKATEKKLKDDYVRFILKTNAKRNTGLFLDKVRGVNNRVNAKVNAGMAADVRSLLGMFLKQNDLDYIHRYAALTATGLAEDLKYKESSVQQTANKIRALHTMGMLLSLGSTKRNLWGNGTISLVDLIANNAVGMITDAAVSQMTGTGERAVGFRFGVLNPKVWAAAYAGLRNSVLEVAGNIDINENTAETDPGKWGMSKMRSFDPNGNVLNRLGSAGEQIMSYMLTSPDAMFQSAEETDIIDALTRANRKNNVSAKEMKNIAREQSDWELFKNKGVAAKSAEWAKDQLNRVGVGGEGKTHKGGFGLGEMTVKFPVVPSNLGVKLVEGSPLNMAKGLIEMTKVIQEARETGKSDLVKQNQAVMDFARGTTGTAMVAALVYLMRSDKFKGLFKAFRNWDNEEDKDVKAMNKAQGKSGMQINLSLWDRLANGDTDETWREGDETIDISANEPTDQYIRAASMIADYIDENPEAALGDKAAAAAWAVGKSSYDSIIGMPLMQNFATIGDSITYSPYKAKEDATDAEKAGAAVMTGLNTAAGMLGSSASGFVPAALAHRAAVQDEWQRDTSGDNALDRAWNQFLLRIPGEKGRESLPIKTDPFGNPISAGDEETRRKNAYGAYKHSKVSTDENTQELEKIREETGKVLYPSRNGPRSYTYTNGDEKTKVEFPTDVSTALKDVKGQAYGQDLTELRNTEEYKNASWGEKAALVEGLKSYEETGTKAKVAEALGIEYDDEYKDIRELKDPVGTMAFKATYDRAKKNEDWNAVDALLDSVRGKNGSWKMAQDSVDYIVGKDSKINYYTYLGDRGVPLLRAKDFETELKTLYEGEKRIAARASDMIRVAGNGHYTTKEADAIMNYEGEVSKESIARYKSQVQYQLEQAGKAGMSNEVWKRIQMVEDGTWSRDTFRAWARNEAKAKSGLPRKQAEEIIDIMTNYTSDNHVAGVFVTSFYNAARSIGCTPKQALQFYNMIDSDYNGSYSKSEIDAAVAKAFGYDSKYKKKYYGKTYTYYNFSGNAKKVRDAIKKNTGR